MYATAWLARCELFHTGKEQLIIKFCRSSETKPFCGGLQLALAGFGAGLTWASAIVRWQ